MEPLFCGFWEGLFSIGLNWIFVALAVVSRFALARLWHLLAFAFLRRLFALAFLYPVLRFGCGAIP